jgi:hypothetical protein
MASRSRAPATDIWESTCYHPLLLFNGEGGCLAAKLRPGNVHSAEGWQQLLLPEIERQQRQAKAVVFRADAAFAKLETYETLEKRDVKYAIRLPSNDNLQRNITELFGQWEGQATNRWSGSRAFSTRRPVGRRRGGGGGGRVPLRGIVPPRGLYRHKPHGGEPAVVRFYNKRGTAEQWIKEGKQAVKMTRLSCHRFRANEVRLWLSVIAYNLGNLWRRLALPAPIGKWSLTNLQQRLVKPAGV